MNLEEELRFVQISLASNSFSKMTNNGDTHSLTSRHNSKDVRDIQKRIKKRVAIMVTTVPLFQVVKQRTFTFHFLRINVLLSEDDKIKISDDLCY